MTGFAFTHGTVAEMTSPTSMPVNLLAFDRADSQASSGNTASGDSALRAAIVSVARNYLQMAQARTPAQMEALIWQADSTDGADHGQSCAAFASLTLALGAQAAGQHSWVTGGGSYPWPLHSWADVRVQANPDSPGIVSIQQDAQAHGRWHPAGDGYRPQPGDWAIFDGHVEVVTRATPAALYTIGADSLPGLTVNAHKFPAPFTAQGVLGFVNNGELASSENAPASTGGQQGSATIPGLTAPALGSATGTATAAAPQVDAPAGTAVIPGSQVLTDSPTGRHTRRDAPPTAVPGTAAQQAFIGEVAPGAIAAQQKYGIPASVTIAQAIEESGWGQSELATADHNLFGIKGTGPAGTDMRPTQEYENGIWVNRTAGFRVYRNIAQSIADHGQLLATSPVYQHAMANRHVPDAFASALTGVYATDPGYGSNLIALMRLYHLYQYDTATRAPGTSGPTAPSIPGLAGAVTALTLAKPLYRDVAGRAGLRWELLAACDWMQCRAEPQYSPVYGERLGTVNPDGTVFRTKSAALAQCAGDLIELAGAVYQIKLAPKRALSVRELANVFAAFRWGGLLRAHDVSAMEFPYSVAGLTAQHRKMRWPDISEPRAPDKPGTRFRMAFGAVPVVLNLGYRAREE
jgi:flagellum-specific peptidoglycan hydrolase FlgJ